MKNDQYTALKKRRYEVNYIARIKEIISTIDLGEPIFTVSVGKKSIALEPQKWEKKSFDESICLEHMISRCFYREYDEVNCEYKVDEDQIIKSVNNNITSTCQEIFIACSPSKVPRRTTAFKDYIKMVAKNKKDNQEFLNNIFDICEYYWNNTQTESINDKNNDVHRQNIYQLLCLMEKRYGKVSKVQY